MAAPPAELMSGTATIDDLPDGVLAEIMLRIPTPVALVHAAAVSKRWRGVTSDGKFLNDYRERHKSSPFLGLYITREFGGLPYFHKADSIHSADGGGDDDSAGGGSSDDDSDPDLQHAADMAFRLDGIKRHGKWRLLDCYNGRLLLTRDDGWLVVYNPLSRKRISVGLPQDGILRNDFSACLLQGRSDDVSSFRVVSVQRHRSDRMVHALEYDSRRKSWNHHQDGEILNKIQGTDQLEMMHAGDLVFCKYTGASLLLLDTSKMEFSVLPLPADNNPKKYAIGEIEDGVCCLAAVDSVGASNTPYLRVWRLEKQDWMLEKAMEVQQVLGEHAPRGNLYYKVRKVTNGIAVLCWSMSNLHLIIDLKTFGVMDQFEFNNDLSAFPMQLPWPPAFSMARISALNPTAAHEGEAEGAKTEGEREEEAAETGGENEEVAEDFNNKGDAAEESPPSCRHCLKQAGTLDPAPEDDEAEEEIPTPWRRCHRQKLGECGQSLPPSPPLPDHLRCRRNDGKKWRCSVRALPTISFCKYHYSKAHKGKIKKVPADGEVLAVTLQRPVATVSVMNPAAALGGEAEGAKTDVKSDEEDTETGGESEDASDDPNTECARRGEVKGLEPDGKIEEECTETAGENEDANSDTEGDDVEESPPSHHHRRKRAATSDPTWEDDEAIPTSEDEEVEILAPLCRRRQRKLGEHGDSLPDHLRCGRRDGKKWRCSARALPTVSFCEYHYTKANKGKIKKVPADGEVLAVSRRRLKYKTINRAEQYTPSTVMNPRSSEGAKIDFHRQRQSRERGDSLPLPDHLRCGRRDGKKWRCSARALPTVSLCEYHYTKANKGKMKRAATPDTTQEDDEAEEILAEHGDSLPDHLRCGRRDGKKWRCSARALPTVSFCEYHYTKANKGMIKKVPADGEVLAVSRRRLKYKTINSAEQYTPSTVMNPRSSEGAKIDFHRQRQSRERGDSLPLPDHLRCGRRDGKKWRCSRRALPTVSFCEYHYAKAKMGKKLPADGELLAVVHQRLKNKRKGGKNINPMVVPQATTSDRQTRDLPNGQMTISPSDPQTSGPAAMPSPVTMKVGVEIPAPIQRCYCSNNAVPLPVGPVKGAPYETSMTKAVPRTSHHCSLTKVAGVANCENCKNNFCNSCKCNNCKLSASQLLDAARHGMDAPGNPSGVKDA